jgi:phospholipase/carboxylesterase
VIYFCEVIFEIFPFACPPVCLVHGEADQVVPFLAFNDALSALKSNNVEVLGYSSKELGHGIDPAGVKIAIDFIKKIIPQ